MGSKSFFSKTSVQLLAGVGLALTTGVGKGVAVEAELSSSPPLVFVENQGQWPERVKFRAQAAGITAGLETGAIVLSLGSSSGRLARRVDVARMRMSFEGRAPNVDLEGEDRQAGTCGFFLGNDPTRWRRGVSMYASVLYSGLYDCIDLRVRRARSSPGEPRILEYDLCLEPGSDLEQVVVRCDGVDDLDVAANGSILISASTGVLRQPPPRTWQVLPDGKKVAVECRYRLIDERRFGFEASAVDPGLPMVVDPVIECATYLGGENIDAPGAVALGPDGTVTVAGWTMSDAFEKACPPGQRFSGFIDCFVMNLSPELDRCHGLVFVGGAEVDGAFGVAVDADGVTTVAGNTTSLNYPTTGDAYQRNFGGGDGDGFLFQLSPPAPDEQEGAGFNLLYSTYFGGSREDSFTDLELGASGDFVLCGYTASEDLFRDAAGDNRIAGAFQEEYGGGEYDAFVVRFQPDSEPPETQLQYGTFLGGERDEANANFPNDRLLRQAVTVKETGEIAVTGVTWSPHVEEGQGAERKGFPTKRAFQAEYGGGGDIYITILKPDMAIQPPEDQLVYSTYLGGASLDMGEEVKWSPNGLLCLVGLSESEDFPVTENALDKTLNGVRDPIVAQLNPDGDPEPPEDPEDHEPQLVYSTYFGGNGRDAGNGLFILDNGDLIVGAVGSCDGFPPDPDNCVEGEDLDLFLGRLDPTLPPEKQLVSWLVIGGEGDDALFVGPVGDGSSTIFVVGDTTSTREEGFPICDGAFDENFNGNAAVPLVDRLYDTFVARIRLDDGIFKRGNANADGDVNLSDAVFILNYLFRGGAAPPCLDAADADDSGVINLTDAVYLLNYLFLGGPEPRAPFEACGEDPTADDLDCGAFPPCR